MRVITNNCNNLVIITKLRKSESAADFSPQKADPKRKQVVRQESYNYTTCKYDVFCVNGYISFPASPRHRLGKAAGAPHLSGPLSAPVFPLLAFLHVAGGLALFFALARLSLSSAVKVGRLVLRDSMGASKLDL